MSELSDRQLVLHTRKGNTATYALLVRRYQDAVFTLCYRLVANRQEAEDHSQMAFIRAYERLETFDLDRPFLPWLRRVATNVCLNSMVRRRLENVDLETVLESLPAPSGYDPARAVVERESTARLYAALLALPPVYRAVIELRHFQEFSYEEISGMLELPLNTVKSHIFRARKMLAEVMRDERPTPP